MKFGTSTGPALRRSALGLLRGGARASADDATAGVATTRSSDASTSAELARGAGLQAGGKRHDLRRLRHVVQSVRGRWRLAQLRSAANVGARSGRKPRPIEIGTKWDLFDGTSVADRGVFPHGEDQCAHARIPTMTRSHVLDGEQVCRASKSALPATSPTAGTVFGGYTYLDSSRSNKFHRQNPAKSATKLPQHAGAYPSASGRPTTLPWDFEVGARRAVCRHAFNNSTATCAKPTSYWLFDAMVAYRSPRTSPLRVNVYNLSDEEYIDRVGGGHFVPGPAGAIIGRRSTRRASTSKHRFSDNHAHPNSRCSHAGTGRARARNVLDKAEWVDGRVTAGHQSAKAKDNMQLPEGSPAARELGDMILGALGKNPLFLSAALPLRVFPPLFNRYSGGQSFGTHVDNAIRQVPGTPHRIRTDLSATLFFAGPDEYDGGELCVEDTYGVQRVKLPAGPYGSLSGDQPASRHAGHARRAHLLVLLDAKHDSRRRPALAALRSRPRDPAARPRFAEQAGCPANGVQLTGVYHNLLRQWAEM